MSFHVERAHTDVGLVYIEYESDPGRIDAGEQAMLMFWIAMDASGDPATGLTVQIVVREATVTHRPSTPTKLNQACTTR